MKLDELDDGLTMNVTVTSNPVQTPTLCQKSTGAVLVGTTHNATLLTPISTAYIQPFYPQLITLTPLLLLLFLYRFPTNTFRPLPLTQTQPTRPLTLPPILPLQPPLFFLPRPLLLLSG